MINSSPRRILKFLVVHLAYCFAIAAEAYDTLRTTNLKSSARTRYGSTPLNSHSLGRKISPIDDRDSNYAGLDNYQHSQSMKDSITERNYPTRKKGHGLIDSEKDLQYPIIHSDLSLESNGVTDADQSQRTIAENIKNNTSLLTEMSCLLYKKVTMYRDAVTQHLSGKHEWMCEVDESYGSTKSSPTMLHIDGLNETFFRNIKAKSGDTILSTFQAKVGIDTIKFDSKTVPTVRSVSRHGRRKLVTTTGEHKVLVVRIVAPDSSSTQTEAGLSDGVFGTYGKTYSVRSSFNACSFGQLRMLPATDLPAKNGVVTVQINQNVKGTGDSVVVDEAAKVLNTMFGVTDLGTIFDHVMFCIPPGTSGGWYAYAYVYHWSSVYNDACDHHNVGMHEIGHNLGLGHSGESGNEYGDQTCFMGGTIQPRTCFNGPKSFQLGWYSSQVNTFNVLNTDVSRSFTLVGIADFQNINSLTTQDNLLKSVILKLESGYMDYYVVFNRKTGIKADMEEYGDQVIVAYQEDTDQSWIWKTLSAAGRFPTLSDINNSGKDVTISVDEINLSSNPAYAKVTISPTYINGYFSPIYGGNGGALFQLFCDGNTRLVNLSGRSGSWVDQLVGTCEDGKTLGPTGGSGGSAVTTPDCKQGFTGGSVTYGYVVGKISLTCGITVGSTIIGGGVSIGSGSVSTFSCPSGMTVNGFGGKSDNDIDSIYFKCKNRWGTNKPTISRKPTPKPTLTISITNIFGGSGGDPYTLYCADGTSLVNLSGRDGWWVDQLFGTCEDGKMLGPTGGSGGSLVETPDCKQGFTGGSVTYGYVVGKISLDCGTTVESAVIGGGLGIGSGSVSTFSCPSGMTVNGFGGKSGNDIDSIYFKCTNGSKLTQKPSGISSNKPTRKPSRRPSSKPTRKPSRKPTRKQSRKPTRKPSRKTTRKPSRKPTRKPSRKPTRKPSRKPTKKPSRKPTRKQSRKPTRKPAVTRV